MSNVSERFGEQQTPKSAESVIDAIQKVETARTFFLDRGMAPEIVWNDPVGHGEMLLELRRTLKVDSAGFESVMETLLDQRKKAKADSLARRKRTN